MGHWMRRANRAARYLAVRAQPAMALQIYWDNPLVAQLWRRAAGVTADLWLANDWNTLPLACRLADERGGRIAYDSHELATREYEERLRWRIFNRPYIATIERKFIHRADAVSTVSSGIADELSRLYDLESPPLVVRSVPAYEHTPFRPTGKDIRVLYHGLVVPGRGLEEAIDSVPLWDQRRTFVIRGPVSSAAYVEGLQRRAAQRGVTDRVGFAPAVPMVDLVRAAAPFDIGFFALPSHSRHNEHALPNKFFEYAAAGLALLVSNQHEMSALLQKYDMGRIFLTPDPNGIATAINGLDPAAIDKYKRNALRAASELCWEREAETVLRRYNDIVAHGRAGKPALQQPAHEELANRAAGPSAGGVRS
jgi:glycosyltransferase involved in cell wall biosynthesis